MTCAQHDRVVEAELRGSTVKGVLRVGGATDARVTSAQPRVQQPFRQLAFLLREHLPARGPQRGLESRHPILELGDSSFVITLLHGECERRIGRVMASKRPVYEEPAQPRDPSQWPSQVRAVLLGLDEEVHDPVRRPSQQDGAIEVLARLGQFSLLTLAGADLAFEGDELLGGLGQ